MKVILKVDVKGSGKAGELVNISDGYARNYLFPRNLAVEANAGNVNEMNNKNSSEAHKKEVAKQEAQNTADALKDKSINIKAKSGDNGRLFGSVTAKEIVSEINKQTGLKIDKKKLVLSMEIKACGVYPIQIKLYPGIVANLKVCVTEL